MFEDLHTYLNCGGFWQQSDTCRMTHSARRLLPGEVVGCCR